MLYVANSTNAKLGAGIDATYAPLTTCPSSCPLRGSGCYAESGNVAIHARRLDREAAGRGPLFAAREEARAIDASHAGGPVPYAIGPDGRRAVRRRLRLHVSGDARSNLAARVVSAAVARWQARGGGEAWVYTHAWRTVARASWGPVSAYASIEDPADGPRALARGYAPALIVSHFPADRFVAGDVEYLACRAQTEGATCAECGACWKGRPVAFAAHGSRAEAVRRALPVLSADGGA